MDGIPFEIGGRSVDEGRDADDLGNGNRGGTLIVMKPFLRKRLKLKIKLNEQIRKSQVLTIAVFTWLLRFFNLDRHLLFVWSFIKNLFTLYFD